MDKFNGSKGKKFSFGGGCAHYQLRPLIGNGATTTPWHYQFGNITPTIWHQPGFGNCTAAPPLPAPQMGARFVGVVLGQHPPPLFKAAVDLATPGLCPCTQPNGHLVLLVGLIGHLATGYGRRPALHIILPSVHCV